MPGEGGHTHTLTHQRERAYAVHRQMEAHAQGLDHHHDFLEALPAETERGRECQDEREETEERDEGQIIS